MHFEQSHLMTLQLIATMLNFDWVFCRVQYENCSNRWTFHPAALVKVCTFQVGDIVTIDTNAAKVEKLQKGHGEWVETMRNVSHKNIHRHT